MAHQPPIQRIDLSLAAHDTDASTRREDLRADADSRSHYRSTLVQQFVHCHISWFELIALYQDIFLLARLQDTLHAVGTGGDGHVLCLRHRVVHQHEVTFVAILEFGYQQSLFATQAAQFVGESGELYENGAYVDIAFAVRPAVWLDVGRGANDE